MGKPGGKKGQRWEATESYQHPPDEINACMTCRLPDCYPSSVSCNLKILREQKLGRRIILKA